MIRNTEGARHTATFRPDLARAPSGAPPLWVCRLVLSGGEHNLALDVSSFGAFVRHAGVLQGFVDRLATTFRLAPIRANYVNRRAAHSLCARGVMHPREISRVQSETCASPQSCH